MFCTVAGGAFGAVMPWWYAALPSREIGLKWQRLLLDFNRRDFRAEKLDAISWVLSLNGSTLGRFSMICP